MVIIISVILLAVVGLVLILSSGSTSNTTSEAEQAKINYNAALDGKDKKAALLAGRHYYSLRRRKRILTIYDELAIANDLTAMPSATSKSDFNKNVVD
jgi:hypothetical protein